MNFAEWKGQQTTGQGAGVIFTALAAVAQGSLTWQQAMVPIVGGLVLVIWPENKSLVDAAETTTKAAIATEETIAPLLIAYRTGLTHGAATVAPAAATTGATPNA